MMWGLRARGLLTLAAMTWCLVLAAPPAEARDLDEVMREAVQARHVGDLDRTVTLLREAYTIRPAPEILNNLGKVLEQMGKYRESYDAYKRVADDEDADPTLRALDSGRVAALQGKLNKAWVLPRFTPENARVVVDGQPTGLPPGVEFPVPHGLHTLQVTHPDVPDMFLRFAAFLLDRRTELVVNLRSPPAHLARLDLGPRPRPREIRIQGKMVTGDLESIDSIYLVPGTYEVVVVGAFDAIGKTTLHLKGGDVGQLPEAELISSIQGRRPGRADAPELPATGAGTPSVRMSTEKIEKPMTLLSVAPWITMGLGAVITGAGGTMMAGAMSEKIALRKDLEISDGSSWTVDGQTVNVPTLSFGEAQSRQADIDSGAQMAQIVLGAGAGVLVGSLVWAMISTSDDGHELPVASTGLRWTAPLVTPTGVRVGASF